MWIQQKQLSTFGTANILAVWYFKKINEILKRVPSNKKLSIFYFSLFYHSLISYSELETNTRNSDQLDSTILIQAGRSSNLIIALQSSNLPPILSQLASLYTQKKKLWTLLGQMGSWKLPLPELPGKKTLNFKNNLDIPGQFNPQVLDLLKTTTNINSPIVYV